MLIYQVDVIIGILYNLFIDSLSHEIRFQKLSTFQNAFSLKPEYLGAL